MIAGDVVELGEYNLLPVVAGAYFSRVYYTKNQASIFGITQVYLHKQKESRRLKIPWQHIQK